ncbi:YciI family protein [Tabrizicola sp.]|jgi:uncharacterized protein YciI|uniref:YciI family protein n=1 Tax=Tabrizicola sp. TaxID=2005166 RepID=UPI0035B03D23
MGDSAFTRYVALLHPVPGLTADIPAIRAHVAWLRSLQAAGSLELADPFADGSGGMVILRAESAAEAEALARSDPFIRLGLRRLELRVWELSCEGNNHMGMG